MQRFHRVGGTDLERCRKSAVSRLMGVQRSGRDPYTFEQTRAIVLAAVDEGVGVAIRCDDLRPLSHPLADLRPGRSLLMEQRNPSVAEGVR